MANKFYAPGSARGEKVKDLFATIAPRYDLLNDLQSFGLHRLWKQRFVAQARITPGDAALDLCCGTGDVAFALAHRGARVVGLDFSEPMLSVARKRLATQCADVAEAVEFRQGDAQALPFPAASFDVVTISYGLRNLADWRSGLREMTRVAKPGARLLVLDFGKPENALWRATYFAYLKVFVPLLGRMFCRNADAYAYILESLKQYPAQHGVAAEMRALELAEVRLTRFLGGVMTIHSARKPPMTPA